MAGFYVKAQYKFDATRRNEVSLRVNDVAFVVQTIDANWYYGIVHKLAGNFPINFVQTLQLPPIRDGEKLFVGIGNFDGQVKGDLSFTKGTTRIIQLRMEELQGCKKKSFFQNQKFFFSLVYNLKKQKITRTLTLEPHTACRKGGWGLAKIN